MITKKQLEKREIRRQERRQKQREYEAWQKRFSKRNDTFKKELKAKATSAELIFKEILTSNRIKYKFQKGFYCKTFHCIVDFFIKSEYVNVCVEIDGGYHDSPEQIRKDKYRTKWLLTERKCHVMRFKNEEILNDADGCIKQLATYFIEHDFIKKSNNYKAFFKITIQGI